MTPQRFRAASGGLIDRAKPLRFTFNGRAYAGFAGDTLASALVANGVRIVGRSFKYHRPRGVFGLGAEEPNALVQLGRGARSDPNSKATQIELFDGLVAASQNCWPTVDFDLGSVTGLFSRLMPAGFYYKTFMWPPRRWIAYEPFIRRMAGLGRSPVLPDPDRYEHRYAHCDVLVVGAGPAGLAAALAAGRSGARLIAADEGARPGGTLLAGREDIGARPAVDWIGEAEAELRAMPEARVLSRTAVFGYYDHNQLGAVERVSDHRPARPGEPRQRVWHIHAREVVLATGAHERSLVFGNNDLPGVMLAGAASGYVNRYAVRAGRAAVVFTNNDSAYTAALDLAAGGVVVRAVVDLRADPPAALAGRLGAAGIEHLPGSAVLHARGWRRLGGVVVARLDGEGKPQGAVRHIECDLLGVSGGWNPAVHLHAQARGRPHFDPDLGAFVPGPAVQKERSAGAARGSFVLADCLAEGAAAGAAAAAACGFAASADLGLTLADEPAMTRVAATKVATTKDRTFQITMKPEAPLWYAPQAVGSRQKRFVDLQNDVTDADIALAVREGYHSVEHVKRYTTLGMGTDQGKTSNAVGFAHVAAALGADIATVGTTTYRPPYVPVALGALAGSEGGRHFAPSRRTPMHDAHLTAGAVMAQTGVWLRPQCYPRARESLEAAARREASAVRTRVGLVDISTLGKLELFGPDAALFLERVYINRWRGLKVGRCRYGVMLREDGIVFDDGTTSRIAETHYFMTVTTGQAPLAARRLDYWHKVLWPELDLRIVSVTDQWAGVALAGPASREVLARVLDGLDIGSHAFPHMAMGTGIIAGVAARVLRISFSGDLAYEIYVPSGHGMRLWRTLTAAGARFGITPYGVDAMNALRIEKGHVAGGELNGRVTADDLGLGRMMRAEGDFIGRRSLARSGLNDPGRWQLVGLAPEDGKTPIPQGAKIVGDLANRYVGELTSTAWSPTLGMPIGLGLVSAGRSRHGERLLAVSPLAGQAVRVIVRSPTFFDPEGERLHA
jgi:sarcosine oxidase, subunit alpha